MDQYSDFIQRLKDIIGLVKSGQYDLGNIPGFESTLSPEMIAAIHQSILDNPDLLEDIENLAPNESLYVKRESKSPKTRTFCIARDASGEFHLFIEPKSKRANDTLRDMTWTKGSFKTRKISLRSDVYPPQVFASMISYNATAESLANTKREIIEQQIFDNTPGIAKVIIGDEAQKIIKDKDHNEIAVTRTITYSPYREQNLEVYLRKNKDNMSREEKSDFILQLINIVKILHSKGKEHKDLKPENILVYFDPILGKNMLEIIDFGFVQDFGSKDMFRGTPRYIPVWKLREIFAGINLQKMQSIANVRKAYRAYLGTYAFDKLTNDLQNSSDQNAIISMPDPIISAGKHDIWSLALICHDIHYGRETSKAQRMENIKKNAFYRDILCSTPEDTPDIEQVLDRVQKSVYKKMADKLQPVIQFNTKADSVNSLIKQVEEFVLDINCNDSLAYFDNEFVSMVDYAKFMRAISEVTPNDPKPLEELAKQFNSALHESQNLLELAAVARVRLSTEEFDNGEFSTPYTKLLFYAGLAYACYTKLNLNFNDKYSNEAAALRNVFKELEAQHEDEIKFYNRFKDPYKDRRQP